MCIDVKFNVSSLILTCVAIGLGISLIEKGKEVESLKATVATLKLAKGDKTM